MATITLSYNPRSSKAKMLLDMILATGLFSREPKPNAKTLASIREAKSGKSAGTVDISSVDAMIKSME